MSDNFDRKVCNGLQSTKIVQLLNLSTQLANTNLSQPITNQCLILFSLWCKKVALAVKEKALNTKHLFFLINFTGSPLYEELLGIMSHSSVYLAILTYIN